MRTQQYLNSLFVGLVLAVLFGANVAGAATAQIVAFAGLFALVLLTDLHDVFGKALDRPRELSWFSAFAGIGIVSSLMVGIVFGVGVMFVTAPFFVGLWATAKDMRNWRADFREGMEMSRKVSIAEAVKGCFDHPSLKGDFFAPLTILGLAGTVGYAVAIGSAMPLAYLVVGTIGLGALIVSIDESIELVVGHSKEMILLGGITILCVMV